MPINEVDSIELKTLSDIMGHANISVTAEVHAHLMHKKKESVIQGFNEAVHNASRKALKVVK